MNFLHPEYFWLLLFLVAAFVKKDFRALRVTSYGYIITFILIVLALTRPVIVQEPIKTQELLNDVVLAVDLSYSMQAEDIAPSRLLFAQSALEEIVKSGQTSRFGVLGFTTNAIILSPLTSDSELLLHLFHTLDYKLIMTKGSSVMPALQLARKMSNSKRVSVVLLTDGADELDYQKEALFAKENNLVVNILMSATRTGTTLKLQNGQLLQDESGDIVVSRENSAIETISDATGGVYAKSVEEIESALESQRDETHKADVTIVQNRELFYYLVALALVVFLVSVTTLKRFVLAFLLLFGITLHADLLEFAKDKNALAFERGVKLYQAGEYEKALVQFESVKSSNPKVKAVVFYNEGNSLVRLKKFEQAREAYKKSLVLDYTKEADENLQKIKNVKKQEEMSTGMQKSKNKSASVTKRENSQKSKSGGSSNMKVSASSGSGAQNKGKKSSSAPKVDLNSGKAKLSSKQYELINKRSINEKKPY